MIRGRGVKSSNDPIFTHPKLFSAAIGHQLAHPCPKGQIGTVCCILTSRLLMVSNTPCQEENWSSIQSTSMSLEQSWK